MFCSSDSSLFNTSFPQLSVKFVGVMTENLKNPSTAEYKTKAEEIETIVLRALADDNLGRNIYYDQGA